MDNQIKKDQPAVDNNPKVSLRDQGRVNVLSLAGLIFVVIVYGFLKLIGLSSTTSIIGALILGIIYAAVVVYPANKKMYAKNYPDGEYKTKLETMVEKLKK